MNQRGYITENGMAVLRFLSDKMGASSRDVGLHLLPPEPGQMPAAQIASIGRSAAMHLRRQGLVTFLYDTREWRITKTGRQAVTS